MTTTNGKTSCKYCDLPEALKVEAAAVKTCREASELITAAGYPIALKTVWTHRQKCDGQVKAPARTKGKKKKEGQAEKLDLDSASGNQSSVKYDEKTGIPTEVSTVSLINDHEQAWADVCKKLGLSLPEGYIARCVEAKHDPAAWVRYGTHAEYETNSESYIVGKNGMMLEDSLKRSKTTRIAPMPATSIEVWRLRFVIVNAAEEEAESNAPAEDLAEAMSWIKSWKMKPTDRRILGKGLGPEVAWGHLQGDEQAGKDGADGILALMQRQAIVTENSINGALAARRKGINVARIVDFAAGDSVENIFGHYNSQNRTTDTLRNQFKAARDSDILRKKAFAEALQCPIDAVYTPSNHGEMRQVVGQAPHTSASDNLDLIIAEQVRDMVELSPMADQITFYIPHDEYMTTLMVCGVGCGLSHGHKIKGAPAAWVQKQQGFFSFHKQFRLQLVFLGHKHHSYMQDVSGTTVFQSSALDNGSEHFEAMTGQRASQGALSVLISDSFRAGWNELNFL